MPRLRQPLRPVPMILAALAAAVPAAWAARAGAEPRERVVNVAMEDQFKRRHETGALRGAVVVLV